MFCDGDLCSGDIGYIFTDVDEMHSSAVLNFIRQVFFVRSQLDMVGVSDERRQIPVGTGIDGTPEGGVWL